MQQMKKTRENNPTKPTHTHTHRRPTSAERQNRRLRREADPAEKEKSPPNAGQPAALGPDRL